MMILLTPVFGMAGQNLNLVCDEWAPYQIVENGKVTGFSTEVVESVFRRMNVSVESITAFPWKRAVVVFEKGKADALFSANYTEERTKFARYPQESIVESPWVLWVRSEDEAIFKSWEDLRGKRIGVVRGYSYTDEFWNFIKKNATYDEVTSDEINFRKLDACRVDYVAAELGNGLYIIKKLGLNSIHPLMETPLKSDGLYIMFNKSKISAEFVEQFSGELAKFKKESVYQYIHEKYFGKK